MLTVLMGSIAALIGVIGVVACWSDFLSFLRGILPVSLFFSGLIAIIAGISRLASKEDGKSS